MKWLSKLFRRIRNWFTPPYQAVLVEDLPDELEPQTIYLVGLGEPWQAAMRCPCGCGSVIQLSLVKRDRPSWQARMAQDGNASLYPSVWRKTGCRSHFFMTRGRVFWC